MMPNRFLQPIAFLAGSLLLGSSAAWSAVTVEEPVIREKVTSHVQDQLQALIPAGEATTIGVEIPQVPGGPITFETAEGLDEISFTLSSPLRDFYSNRAVVRVRMQDGTGQHREIGVPVKISIRKPVWVVKNVVPAKAPLRTRDFKLEVREVGRSYSHVVGSERPLNQYLARVNLRPGELLDARKIIIPPDVTYNSDVRILMSNGNGMTVTIPGVALSDGRVGETIRVRQAAFKRKTYSAKIIDKNRVLVEM